MNFPFKNSLRLSTIIGYWELQQYEDNEILAQTAKSLIKKVDEHPFLREEIHDLQELEPVKDVVNLIMSAVVPPAVSNDQILAIFKPFSLEYFYATTPFKKLVTQAGSLPAMVQHMDQEELEEKKTMSAYHAILFQFYGVELPMERQMVLQLQNDTTTYYHLFFDPRFCEVKLRTESAPDLTAEELDLLVRESNNEKLWREKLPPELFEFTGFAIYTLIEATHQEAFNNIKEALQSEKEPGEEFLSYFNQQISDLTGVADVNIGISLYHSFRQVYDRCEEGGSMSLMVDGNKNFIKAFLDISHDLIKKGQPDIITDTEESDYFSSARPDFKSFMAIPLYSGSAFIGHFELGSYTHKLGPLVYAKVLDVIPILATALAKRVEELENKISVN